MLTLPFSYIRSQNWFPHLGNCRLLNSPLEILSIATIHAAFLWVSRQPNSTWPVVLLSKYLTLRDIRPGANFVSEGGLPVSRSVFSSQLLSACHLCGLDPSRYKGHSFRIGAASYAADRGLSDAQIRMLGRWKSNAFLQYIRVPSLNSWTNNWAHLTYWQGGAVCMGGWLILLLLSQFLFPKFHLANSNLYHPLFL